MIPSKKQKRAQSEYITTADQEPTAKTIAPETQTKEGPCQHQIHEEQNTLGQDPTIPHSCRRRSNSPEPQHYSLLLLTINQLIN